MVLPTSSLCGFQSTEAGILPRVPLPTSSCLQQPAPRSRGDLDAETVAAVAVTRTQGHCCSPGSTTNAPAAAALDIFSVSRAGARQAGKGTESGRWERAPCPRLMRAPSLAPVVRGLRAVDNASRRVRRAPPANPVKLDQEQQVWSRVEEKTSQNPYTTQPKVLDTGIQQRTKQPSDFVESRFA